MQRRDFLLMAGAASLTPATAASGAGSAAASAAGSRVMALDDHGAEAEWSVTGKTDPDAIALIEAWIGKSARAVAAYYGKFPVPRVLISVRFTSDRQRVGGRAWPFSPPRLELTVPVNADETALMRDDWVLVHEMTHLAFPYIPSRRHDWMVEGLAVYVEPIARIMAGHMDARQMWTDFIRMMPRGLPAPGDMGYDVTQNWARTYWGGAIFCLVCDIRCRQATDNRKGLRDALRGINAETDFSRDAGFAETLALGDKATGTTTLTDAWKQMREEPYDPDLEALWKSLGVLVSGSDPGFDESAPLAPLRRAITTA